MELGCCSKCRMRRGAPGEVPTRPAIMPKPRDEGAGLYRPPSRPLRRSSSRSTLTKLTDRPRNPTIRSHLMRQTGRESLGFSGGCGCLPGMVRGDLDGGVDELGDGPRSGGVRPGDHDLARAQVGDRYEDQLRPAVLAGDGGRYVGHRLAECDHVE